MTIVYTSLMSILFFFYKNDYIFIKIYLVVYLFIFHLKMFRSFFRKINQSEPNSKKRKLNPKTKHLNST